MLLIAPTLLHRHNFLLGRRRPLSPRFSLPHKRIGDIEGYHYHIQVRLNPPAKGYSCRVRSLVEVLLWRVGLHIQPWSSMPLSPRLHFKDVWRLQALYCWVDGPSLHIWHLRAGKGVPSRCCRDWRHWCRRWSCRSSALGQAVQHQEVACTCLCRAVHPYRSY